MRTFLKILFWVFFAVLVIVFMHSTFNGGIENMVEITKADGFFEFLKQYFMEIWSGFKTTLGF